MKTEALKTETAKRIIREINLWTKKNSALSVNYSNWYVGITADETNRKSSHKSNNYGEIFFWQCFNARSVNIARAIETYFHKKGMLEKDLPGAITERSKFVYVYKKNPTLVDLLT